MVILTGSETSRPDFEGSVTHFMGAHTIRQAELSHIRAMVFKLTTTPPIRIHCDMDTAESFSASSTSGWPLASFLLGTPASGTVTIPYAGSYQWFTTRDMSKTTGALRAVSR